MIKLFITVAIILMAAQIPASAFAESGTKREILNLTRAIEDALLDSTASESSLSSAKDKLQLALNLLQKNDSSAPSDDCINFTYKIYYMTLSSNAAMDKAAQACRGDADLDVLKYLYEKFYMSLSSQAALDKAVSLSKNSMYGKLPIVEFAYSKYYLSLSANAAAEKAAQGAVRVSARAQSCVESSYARYYLTQGASQAMDSAFNACAN